MKNFRISVQVDEKDIQSAVMQVMTEQAREIARGAVQRVINDEVERTVKAYVTDSKIATVLKQVMDSLVNSYWTKMSIERKINGWFEGYVRKITDSQEFINDMVNKVNIELAKKVSDAVYSIVKNGE